MNILLVTMEMNIGGAETHVLELAKALKKRNNEVCVVSAGGKLVDELTAAGIEHIYAPLKDKKPSHIINSYKIIKKAINEKNIDIVHAHARIPGAICGMVCKKTKTHFVTTIHGMFRVNLVLKLLTNWGEKTLAVSEDIKKHAIKEYKLKEENVFVTVNGIDTEKFKKKDVSRELLEELKLNENEIKVMHISRLDKESTQIAETLIKISDELKNSNIKIIIVGSGNNFEQIENLAKNKSNVILTGARRDIDDILNLADIFVGVSRAALEAMACELPVILVGNRAYNQGYQGIFNENMLEEARKTNFTARGFDEVNSDTLKNAIVGLINNKRIEYNRSVVQDYYSVEKMAEDAIRVYTSFDINPNL